MIARRAERARNASRPLAFHVSSHTLDARGLFGCRGDTDDLARSVIESLNQPDARTQQAQLGRERVLEMYTYEDNAEAYEAIYMRAIEY